MPWYKIEAWCGPGHQSHSIHYHFSRRRLKEPQKKELWEAKFDGRDAAMGKFIRINTLPAQVHRSKVFDYSLTISHAQGMLEILETTPAETKYRGYSILFTRGYERHADWGTKCAGEGFVVRKKLPGGETHCPFPRIDNRQMWFFGENGAKHAIDLFIKAGRKDERFVAAWKEDRRGLREARRIVNARR